MAVVAADLLQCAVALTRDIGAFEASARAAISRSYYAAYHDSTAWHDTLPARGSVPPDFREKGTHVEFAAMLQNPATASITAEQAAASKKRGLALRALHGDRVRADYRLGLNISAVDARNALANARKIIQTI